MKLARKETDDLRAELTKKEEQLKESQAEQAEAVKSEQTATELTKTLGELRKESEANFENKIKELQGTISISFHLS